MSAWTAFWTNFKDNHPKMATVLEVALIIVTFFVAGHFLVWLGQQVVLVAGRIAEKAMLFAVLWLTADYVAYDFFSHLIGGVATTLSTFSLLALTLLPEIILYSAVVKSLTHWSAFFRSKQKGELTWAVLYTVPTLLFCTMTVMMLWALASSGGHFQQASDTTLVIRCLAGWAYSLVTLIHAAVGRRLVSPVHPAQVVTPVVTIPDELIEELRTELATVYDPQLAHLRTQLEDIASLLLTQSATRSVQEVATNVTTAKEENQGLSVQESGHFQDTDSLPVVDSQMNTMEATPVDSVCVQHPSKKTVKLYTRKDTKPTTASVQGEAKKRAEKVLRKSPGIGASALAKQANISRSYATQILSGK